VALTAALRAGLADRGEPVLGEAALRARMLGAVLPAELGPLDRAFAEAVAAHAAGEFERSNQALHAVVTALEALPDGPEVFSAWSRAMLRLARSEQELGRGLDAQGALERLLRAAPDTRPDSRLYPPSFLTLVADARERLRALGTARLTVEAGPGTRIFVDGREVGPAPARVELSPGPHRVTGLCGGLRPPALLVEVASSRTVALDTGLVDALRPDAGPGLALAGADQAGLARAALSQLSLGRAVTVELVEEHGVQRLEAALVEAAQPSPVRSGRIALEAGHAAPAAVAALAAWLEAGEPSAMVTGRSGSSLVLLPSEAARALGGPAAPGPATSGKRTATGWTAVGLGATALAAGLLAVVSAADAQAHYADAQAMVVHGELRPPHTVAEYNAALSAGDRRRTTAVATAVVAGASAAAAAVLGWSSWKETGAVGPLRF
jgi:hypothetical protein